MKNLKKWTELADITALKYQKVAQEYAQLRQKDDALATQFQAAQRRIAEVMNAQSASDDLRQAELNKVRWRRMAEAQQARLNFQRLELKMSLEATRARLAYASGQREVSKTILATERVKRSKRLAGRDQ